MTFGIENTEDGFVVTFLLRQADGSEYWLPLKNFGDREGDAKAFKQYDLPKFTIAELELMVKHYNPAKKYKRIDFRRYVTVK